MKEAATKGRQGKASALEELGLAYAVLHQRRFSETLELWTEVLASDEKRDADDPCNDDRPADHRATLHHRR